MKQVKGPVSDGRPTRASCARSASSAHEGHAAARDPSTRAEIRDLSRSATDSRYLTDCVVDLQPDRYGSGRLIGQYSRPDANGVPQVCFIGVTNPQNPRVETPQEVCDDLLLASKHIPKERLGSTDDCGFSPFSIDVKPKHGSPDVARDIAFQKIRSRVEGTRMASEKLEVASAA